MYIYIYIYIYVHICIHSISYACPQLILFFDIVISYAVFESTLLNCASPCRNWTFQRFTSIAEKNAIRMEVAASRQDHLPTLSVAKTSKLSLLVKHHTLAIDEAS